MTGMAVLTARHGVVEDICDSSTWKVEARDFLHSYYCSVLQNVAADNDSPARSET